MYLVMVRTNLDDLPIRLFTDRESAVKFADSLDPEQEQEQLSPLFAADLAGLHSVAVVSFDPETNKPVDVDTIHQNL